jgi:DNA-binding transcriptional ArsR family regulator
MELLEAVTTFAALAQETRLQALRELIKAGESGLAAGDLGQRLGVPNNTLSFHLGHLSNAGIVRAEKRGRSVIYRANFDTMIDVINYLAADCCSDERARVEVSDSKGTTTISLRACCE